MNKHRHFLTIKDFDQATLIYLIDSASALIHTGAHRQSRLTHLSDKTIATVFMEPSTRTCLSFILAAKRLGADVVNLDVAHSSICKGESLLDTLYTLEAMHCDAVILRLQKAGAPVQLAQQLKTMQVINGGDGAHAHPSQALLDMLTIKNYKKEFSHLSIAIVGDSEHSRVARSQLAALHCLGATDIRLIGPPDLLIKDDLPATVSRFDTLEKGLDRVDVIIVLRIQKERLESDLNIDEKTYFKNYGLKENDLSHSKEDVIILHPGPMNRNIEIASAVADGKHSKIREQVSNGIAMRMVILDYLLGTSS